MKKMCLTIEVDDDFVKGDCIGCPIAWTDDGRDLACPLHETHDTCPLCEPPWRVPSELMEVPEYVSVLIDVPSEAPFPTVFEAYRVLDSMVAAAFSVKGKFPISEVERWREMPGGEE